MRNGAPLREGVVEAFGVDPRLRRRGIGTALQQHAARQCRNAGCYQMRSRSPVTSVENYALKIKAGYVLHPATKTTPTTFCFACEGPGRQGSAVIRVPSCGTRSRSATRGLPKHGSAVMLEKLVLLRTPVAMFCLSGAPDD
jgi:hypothetical protein